MEVVVVVIVVASEDEVSAGTFDIILVECRLSCRREACGYYN